MFVFLGELWGERSADCAAYLPQERSEEIEGVYFPCSL